MNGWEGKGGDTDEAAEEVFGCEKEGGKVGEEVLHRFPLNGRARWCVRGNVAVLELGVSYWSAIRLQVKLLHVRRDDCRRQLDVSSSFRSSRSDCRWAARTLEERFKRTSSRGNPEG